MIQRTLEHKSFVEKVVYINFYRGKRTYMPISILSVCRAGILLVIIIPNKHLVSQEAQMQPNLVNWKKFCAYDKIFLRYISRKADSFPLSKHVYLKYTCLCLF